MKFEELSGNIRALILAKLAMELETQHCANLQELAKRRRTDVMSVWRGICRSSAQPICSLPSEFDQAD